MLPGDGERSDREEEEDDETELDIGGEDSVRQTTREIEEEGLQNKRHIAALYMNKQNYFSERTDSPVPYPYLPQEGPSSAKKPAPVDGLNASVRFPEKIRKLIFPRSKQPTSRRESERCGMLTQKHASIKHAYATLPGS